MHLVDLIRMRARGYHGLHHGTSGIDAELLEHVACIDLDRLFCGGLLFSLRWHWLKMVTCFEILCCSEGCFASKHIVVWLFSSPLPYNIFLQSFANRSVFIDYSSTSRQVVWKLSRTDSCNDLRLVIARQFTTSVPKVNQTCPLKWVHIFALLVCKVLNVTLGCQIILQASKSCKVSHAGRLLYFIRLSVRGLVPNLEKGDRGNAVSCLRLVARVAHATLARAFRHLGAME